MKFLEIGFTERNLFLYYNFFMRKYYEKDNIQLILGDCIDVLDKITPESIDMIFADPPYMLSNCGITCQSGKVVSVNKGSWDNSKGFDEDLESVGWV